MRSTPVETKGGGGAQAIRDGAVDATLDYDTQCMLSKDVVDVYSTTEPQVRHSNPISTARTPVCASGCDDTPNIQLEAFSWFSLGIHPLPVAPCRNRSSKRALSERCWSFAGVRRRSTAA